MSKIYTSKKVLQNIEGMNLCSVTVTLDDEERASLNLSIPFSFSEDAARRLMAKMVKDSMST